MGPRCRSKYGNAGLKCDYHKVDPYPCPIFRRSVDDASVPDIVKSHASVAHDSAERDGNNSVV